MRKHDRVIIYFIMFDLGQLWNSSNATCCPEYTALKPSQLQLEHAGEHEHSQSLDAARLPTLPLACVLLVMADPHEASVEERVSDLTWEGPVCQVGVAVRNAAKIARGHAGLTEADVGATTRVLEGALNSAGLSAEHAAAQCSADTADAAVLLRHTADDEERGRVCEREIAGLEGEMERERVAKERRMQYEAMAEVVLREVGRKEAGRKIKEEEEKAEWLEEEEKALMREQVNMRREFSLVLQGTDDMQAYAQSEKEKAGKAGKARDAGGGNGERETKNAATGDAEMVDV